MLPLLVFFRRLLLRIALVLIFGLATILPDYGLVAQTGRYAMDAPIGVFAAWCVWLIPASLILPLSRRAFQFVSSAGIVAFYCAIVWVFAGGKWDALAPGLWLWVSVPVLLILGWLMVSSDLWTRVRGIRATQDDHAEHPAT